MSDYIDRARYLIKNGYVQGYDVDTLAEKLHKSDKKPTPEGIMTRESVYGKENIKQIQHIVDNTAANKKQLISPGERRSAALSDDELDDL